MRPRRQSMRPTFRVGFNPSGRTIVLLLLLTPLTMGGDFTACLTLLQLSEAITAPTVRQTQSASFTSCGTCFQSRGGHDYFDIPTAPEHPFIVTFNVEGLDGLVDATSVQACLVLKNCGSLAENRAFRVDFVEQGLGLTARVSHIPSECINTGQRSPAYWEVTIDRTSNDSIRVAWEINWVEYRPIPQPLLPNDPTE